MTSLKQDIQHKLGRLNVLEKIIAINVLVFVIGFIAKQFLLHSSSLFWLELPSDFFDFLYKPWTIITYGFAHYGFLHILFNMIEY